MNINNSVDRAKDDNISTEKLTNLKHKIKELKKYIDG